MTIPTAENDAFNEHPARQTLVCLGCGGHKPIGLIVCWMCFKRRPDGRSLKPWLDGTDRTFEQWLHLIGRVH